MGNLESLLAVTAGALAFVLLAGLVIWVLLIIARWKLFKKAGEAGWKSIIPIYSDYIQWKIGWNKKALFWVYIAAVVVGSILVGISGVTSAQLMGTAPFVAGSIGSTVLLCVGLVLIFAALVLAYMAAYKLFISFGHGAGMYIAYLFFPNIVLLVLGFGGSQWLGAQD